MILPTILRAWQIVADSAVARDLVFGGTLQAVYTCVVAGKNVSALPKGYNFTHPSPPAGSGSSEAGPFFFVGWSCVQPAACNPCAARVGTQG